MKKQILIIFITIYCQSTLAQNDNTNSLEFDLNCKVADQILLSIEDGVAKRYPKHADGPAIGEMYKLRFNLEHSPNFYNLKISTPNAPTAGFRLIFFEFKSTDVIYQGDSFRFENGKYRSGGTIGKNLVLMGNNVGSMHLEKYLKNDWQLIGTGITATFGTHALTANCVDMPETYNEIIKIMESVSGELN